MRHICEGSMVIFHDLSLEWKKGGTTPTIGVHSSVCPTLVFVFKLNSACPVALCLGFFLQTRWMWKDLESPCIIRGAFQLLVLPVWHGVLSVTRVEHCL